MTVKRNLVGIAASLFLLGIVAVSVGLFRGSFTKTVPVTVISDRAGLVMNPGARVKLNGAEIGKVSSIDAMPDSRVALHLAIDPAAMDLLPANTGAEITSSTVFGAKFVELVPPAAPSSQPLRPGQVLQGDHVTVEINTVFERLVGVLDKIEPAKLNETLGAIGKAFDGRGQQLGQTMVDLDSYLTTLNQHLPNIGHILSITPQVLGSYADASPDLLATVGNATRISDSIVDEQTNLDALLVSVIGLADVGNDVVSTNRSALTNVLHLLAPTTDLTNEYAEGLHCGLAGLVPLAIGPPSPVPGVLLSDSFLLGSERYRYPTNLPKVAASGGPQCMGLPIVQPNTRPPYLVTDINSNPAQYGNQGILLNSDGLKQALFGPLVGPPRNTAQIGQPG